MKRQKSRHAKITWAKDVDARNIETLESAGWRVAEVWECAIKGRTRITPEQIGDRLEGWLRSGETGKLEIRGRDEAAV